MGNGPLEQPLVYEVDYNGTKMNVSSPTVLIFSAPWLPVGVFAANVTVNVTAVNKFGSRTPSDADDFVISKLYMHTCISNGSSNFIYWSDMYILYKYVHM